jgi:hypothetical protein
MRAKRDSKMLEHPLDRRARHFRSRPAEPRADCPSGGSGTGVGLVRELRNLDSLVTAIDLARPASTDRPRSRSAGTRPNGRPERSRECARAERHERRDAREWKITRQARDRRPRSCASSRRCEIRRGRRRGGAGESPRTRAPRRESRSRSLGPRSTLLRARHSAVVRELRTSRRCSASAAAPPRARWEAAVPERAGDQREVDLARVHARARPRCSATTICAEMPRTRLAERTRDSVRGHLVAAVIVICVATGGRPKQRESERERRERERRQPRASAAPGTDGWPAASSEREDTARGRCERSCCCLLFLCSVRARSRSPN